MLTILAAQLVHSLYDQFRRFTKVEYTRETGYFSTALVVSFSMHLSEHGYGKDGNTLHGYGEKDVRRHAHFILCGNVHVWAYIGSESDPFVIPIDEWENTSNHDSCWRSDGVDGVLSKMYFNCCDEVQEHLPKELKKCPNDISEYNRAGRFMGERVFDFVDITFGSSKDDDYRFVLTKAERSKKKLVLQEQEEEK